jgi:hypothetical protein
MRKWPKEWPDEAQRLIGYRASDRLNWVEGRDNDNVLRPAVKGAASGPADYVQENAI